MIEDYLPEIGMELNDKTRIGNVEDGITYLGIDIFPHYSILGKKRINRLYASKFRSTEEAYKSISSRKGQFTRYHGRHLAKRWYYHLPEEIREEVKMNSDCSAVLIRKKEGGKECRKNKGCTNNSQQ